MTRGFAAPRPLVFDAFTRPELVRRWLTGPDGWTMPVCEIDLTVGGAYRYGWQQPGRDSFGVSGVFREIVRPERIVHSENFEPGWYSGEALVTTTFHQDGGGTLVRMAVDYGTAEIRDKAVATGMAKGVERSYERLGDMLASPYVIVDVERQATAVVSCDVAFAGIRDAQQSARAKIATALPRLGAGKPGAAVTLTRMTGNGRLYMEPGVIVERSFAPEGDVVPSELPAGRAVRHLLLGSFEQLPQAWPALLGWCEAQGLKRDGRCWEIYGPQASGPAIQQTELFALLAG